MLVGKFNDEYGTVQHHRLMGSRGGDRNLTKAGPAQSPAALDHGRLIINEKAEMER